MSRMLRISTVVLIGIFSCIRTGTPAFSLEEETGTSGLSGRLEIDFASQYIWRGLEYNRQAVVQPLVRLNDSGFEVEVRGNLDLTGSNHERGKFTEWNYRGGLAKRTQDAAAGLFYTYYDFPENSRSKTQELSLELAYGFPTYIGTELYWDFDQADGFYWKTSLGYVWEIGILSIIPEVGIGFATKNYQKYYFGINQNSWLDVDASIKLELEIVSGLSLMAEGLYYELMRSNQRDSQKDIARGEHFWAQGGLVLRF